MCEWILRDIQYKCREPAYGDSRYCILHSKEGDKDLYEFTKKVENRIDKSEKEVDLVGCYFPKEFDYYYFQRGPSNRFVGKLLNFREATFCQEVDFDIAKGTEVAIEATPLKVNFMGAKFLDKAISYNVSFSKVDFRGTTFSQGVNFCNAEFLEEVNFSGAIFENLKSDFRGAIFRNAVTFSDAQFKGDEVSFSNAKFFGKTDFNNPHFDCQVYFIKTTFTNNCTFRWAEFPRTHKMAVFEETDLSKCSFLRSNVDKIDFRYCTFNKRLGRRNILQDELDADEGEVDYEHVRRLYLELKKNFEDKKDWDTAGDFHYGEMECKRNMKGWLSLEGFYWLLSGYGERPRRAAVSLGLLIGFCALGYMYFEDFVSRFEGDYVRAFLKSGCDSVKITTLQRIGHVKEYTSLPAKFIFMFESIMGPILIALLALALRRKVKR